MKRVTWFVWFVLTAALLAKLKVLQVGGGYGGAFKLRIALDLMEPSERKPGYLRFGVDIDDVELVVKPGEERVYEVDNTGGESAYQTVYHRLALSARLLGAI